MSSQTNNKKRKESTLAQQDETFSKKPKETSPEADQKINTSFQFASEPSLQTSTLEDDDDDDIFNFSVEAFGVKATITNTFEESCKEFREQIQDMDRELKIKKECDELNRQIEEHNQQIASSSNQIVEIMEERNDIRSLQDRKLSEFEKTFSDEFQRFCLVDIEKIDEICLIVEKIEENLMDGSFLLEDGPNIKYCFESLQSICKFGYKSDREKLSKKKILEIELKLNQWRRVSKLLFNMGLKKLKQSTDLSKEKEFKMFYCKFALHNWLSGSSGRGYSEFDRNYWLGFDKEECKKVSVYYEGDDREALLEKEATNCQEKTLPENYYQIEIGQVSFLFSSLDDEMKNELVKSFLEDFGFNEQVSFRKDLEKSTSHFYPLLFGKSIASLTFNFNPTIYLIISKILLLIIRNSLEMKIETERILEIQLEKGQYKQDDKEFLDEMLLEILNVLKTLDLRNDFDSFYLLENVTNTFHVCIKSHDIYRKELQDFIEGIGYKIYLCHLTLFNNSRIDPSNKN